MAKTIAAHKNQIEEQQLETTKLLASSQFIIRKRQIDDNIFLTDVAIVQQIGSGAFGNVFKGVWGGTTAIAMKSLCETDYEAFELEAQTLR
jgi:hypothetical protein